ncbi:MAG: GMC family oxidoreductase [Deltaproteobacteria bacterium]|nr:GMC family oxidoreductase [Deltaproteobacteria bacterium]
MRRTVYGNESLDHFDALVIGSGAGGGPVAYVLATNGLKVLVLEAGPCHLDYLDDPNRQPVTRFSNDELKLEHRNFIEVHESVEPRTWRTTPADGDRSLTGNVQNLPKTVGGGCLHADLKMPRFEPTDFQLGTLLAGKFSGTSFADWPVQYDELEPFYAWGERLLGVQGLAGANPFEGPRSADYPMPPGPVMYGSTVVGKGLSALGYTMFPYPTAVNSIPYDGRPACVNCGFCSGYPCAILVGKNLMFHYQTVALGIFDERVHGYRGRTVAHGFADFRGKPNDPNKPLGGIVEISGGGFPIGEAQFYARIVNQLRGGRWDGALFKQLMRQSPGRDRVMVLVMQAEDAPQLSNVVDLDPSVVDLDGLPVARCTYQNHAFEVDAGTFYEPKLLDIFQAAGARYTAIAPRDAIPSSQHIMGTLRSGVSPASSVTDKNGRFWDLGNLYASDGAIFPTSSGYNPTMTIVAMALRVAAAIVKPSAPASVIV